jgi:hypothetical protein
MFLDENDITKATHQPYSPDLAPPGFILFAPVNLLLRGAEFPDQDSLFDAIV